MKKGQKVFNKSGILVAVLFSVIPPFANAQNIANGEKIFKQACASCHSVTDKKQSYHTGPALFGVTKRPGRTDQWLTDWISDPAGMLKKDNLAKQILKENNGVPMPNMLATLYSNDAAKVRSATQDILAYLKQNDQGPAADPAAGRRKRN